jgi:hypothetical protein
MLSTFAYEAAGALDTRLSLRPLIMRGEISWQNLSDWRGGNEKAWLIQG